MVAIFDIATQVIVVDAKLSFDACVQLPVVVCVLVFIHKSEVVE